MNQCESNVLSWEEIFVEIIKSDFENRKTNLCEENVK